MKARTLLVFAVLSTVVASVLLGMVGMPHMASAAPSASSGKFPPGTHREFAYLTAQHSNSCGLQPSAVETDGNSVRIQGACCSPMDWTHYQQQVHNLQRFRNIALVPRDPYDVPASLAKQLFRYESSIHLSKSQRAVYHRAMQIAPEKGPCCCKCWRWHAFAGLSRYLIIHEHMNARSIAHVISSVDGCGGK